MPLGVNDRKTTDFQELGKTSQKRQQLVRDFKIEFAEGLGMGKQGTMFQTNNLALQIVRRYLGKNVYDLSQEVKEVWNAWNIKCGDNDGGEGGTRDQMERGEGKLNSEEESDHEPLVSLVKKFQGDPSDGSEEYESEGSGQENSLRSH